MGEIVERKRAEGGKRMSDAPTFGRYAEIPVDRMTPDQMKGYRSMIDGPRGRLPGPYKVWVHNSKLLQAAAPLGEHFTPGQSSLSEREREIAVVVITNRWHSAYPPAAHERRGKEVGLPAATVEAIMAGLPTSFSDAREQVVYEVATTLAGGRLVSQGLYDRAVKALGHEGVTDMIVLMGYYTAVSLTMNLDRKSTRLNSSHSQISYAVFCLKKQAHIHKSFTSFTHRTSNKCMAALIRGRNIRPLNGRCNTTSTHPYSIVSGREDLTINAPGY